MIEQTRAGVAQAVNTGMTSLYWRIGKRIQSEILKGQRADYGKEIVATLSQQLVSKFGTGFSAKNLRHMIRFAERFPDREIVSTLWRQLSWSHFKGLIYLDDRYPRCRIFDRPPASCTPTGKTSLCYRDFPGEARGEGDASKGIGKCIMNGSPFTRL